MSALTKFDALDAHLDTHGPAGVSSFASLLASEVLSDRDLALPAQGETAYEAVSREVNTAVKKYVGQRFGVWKKDKEARAQPQAASGA